MKRWRMVVALAAMGATLLPGTGVQAATKVLVHWSFDGTASRTWKDVSGASGITATSGADVVLLGTAIRTPWIANHSSPPTAPGRLTTANDARLQPNTGEFAVQMRFRTTQNYGNVIQKGQSGTKGGYWKWEQPNGRLVCLFRDAQSRNLSANAGTARTNTGAWTTVRSALARRTDGTAQVTLTITVGTTAPVVRRTSWMTSVPSATARRLSISGKSSCDQVKTTCDYFAGDIDDLVIETQA